MDVDIPSNLRLQVRQIRNIDIWENDLLPLIVHETKIPSTPINAYGAHLQDNGQQEANYTIFSSWLGSLVSGVAKEGVANGTVDGHIQAAVSRIVPLTYNLDIDRPSSILTTQVKCWWHPDAGYSPFAVENPFIGY